MVGSFVAEPVLKRETGLLEAYQNQKQEIFMRRERHTTARKSEPSRNFLPQRTRETQGEARTCIFISIMVDSLPKVQFNNSSKRASKTRSDICSRNICLWSDVQGCGPNYPSRKLNQKLPAECICRYPSLNCS